MRVFVNRVSPEQFGRAIDAVVARAVAGDWQCVEFLCKYVLGSKPMSLAAFAASEFFDDDREVIREFEELRSKQSCRTYASARSRRQLAGEEPVEAPRF